MAILLNMHSKVERKKELVNRIKKYFRCPNRCDGTFNTKNPHRLVRSEIAKIKCQCPFCKQGILYDDVEKH